MNEKPKIAILGGGGRTGRFLITELLRQKYLLRLLLRKPEYFSLQHESVEIIQGDAIDLRAIDMLLQGCHAVISTIGQRKDEPLVATHSTKNIIKAMVKYKIRRYILIAGINIDARFDKKGPQTTAATVWMKTGFPEIQKDRQNAYSILGESDLDWTLVRVPMIEFAEGKGDIRVSVEDCLGTSIAAGDIADFLIQQLSDERYLRQAPFIAANR